MNLNLADYAASMDPTQRQALMAQIVRGRQRTAGSEQLAQAHEQQTRFDPLAAAAPLMNNPAAVLAANSAQKSAGAAKPVQMGQQGFMLPESGEFVESPMYVDEKNAARQARADGQQAQIDARASEGALRRSLEEQRLQQQQEAQQSRYALMQSMVELRRQALENSREAATARKVAADERAADKDSVEVDKGVQKLSAFADKKQLPRLVAQGRQLLKAIEAAGDKDVPGLTTEEQMAARVPFGDRFIDPVALDNMSAYQGISNALTRADAGLSQTQGEVLRQQLETFNKPTTSAKTRAQILRTHILPLVESARAATLGSAPEPVRSRYRKNVEETGGDPSWMDPLFSAPAPAAPGKPKRIKFDANGNEVTQ